MSARQLGMRDSRVNVFLSPDNGSVRRNGHFRLQVVAVFRRGACSRDYARTGSRIPRRIAASARPVYCWYGSADAGQSRTKTASNDLYRR